MTTILACLYVASYPDLIEFWRANYSSFGATTYQLPVIVNYTPSPFITFAINHWNSHGQYEGRRWRFNAENYHIRYPDLQAVYITPGFRGNNLAANNLAGHFISYGYGNPENRIHDYSDCGAISGIQSPVSTQNRYCRVWDTTC